MSRAASQGRISCNAVTETDFTNRSKGKAAGESQEKTGKRKPGAEGL